MDDEALGQLEVQWLGPPHLIGGIPDVAGNAVGAAAISPIAGVAQAGADAGAFKGINIPTGAGPDPNIFAAGKVRGEANRRVFGIHVGQQGGIAEEIIGAVSREVNRWGHGRGTAHGDVAGAIGILDKEALGWGKDGGGRPIDIVRGIGLIAGNGGRSGWCAAGINPIALKAQGGANAGAFIGVHVISSAVPGPYVLAALEIGLEYRGGVFACVPGHGDEGYGVSAGDIEGYRGGE